MTFAKAPVLSRVNMNYDARFHTVGMTSSCSCSPGNAGYLMLSEDAQMRM
jgi:hypothetical protein